VSDIDDDVVDDGKGDGADVARGPHGVVNVAGGKDVVGAAEARSAVAGVATSTWARRGERTGS
jgi:hypothetical protein